MSVIADPAGAVFCIWHCFNKHGVELRDENNTVCWSNYFRMEDCGAAGKRALDLGAKSMIPTTPIPEKGFFCLLADPTGAVFGLYQSLEK